MHDVAVRVRITSASTVITTHSELMKNRHKHDSLKRMISFEHSTVMYCVLQLNIRPSSDQLYLFFGVAFMPLLKNKETCPDNFLCWQFPGLDHCSTIEVDKWREWKLNFVSKICRFFTSICMEGWVNYIPWHLARSHLPGLRNSDFQTHAAMLGFVRSVYLFSSSVWL